MELDLKEYIQIIVKRLPIIIALTLFAALLSGLISFFLLEDIYQASASIIVSNKKDEVNINDLNMSRSLVDTYSEIATSYSVLKDVQEALQADISTEELASKISVSGVGDTEIIKILVEDKDPETAALIANTLAVIFRARVKELLLLDNVQIMDEARIPTAPIKPRPLFNIIIAAFIGLMVGLGIVFLMEYIDNTIKTPEDVERYLGLPVIGSIPSYDIE